MNPFANTLVILGLTQGMDGATPRELALQSLSLAFLIVAAITFSPARLSYLVSQFG